MESMTEHQKVQRELAAVRGLDEAGWARRRRLEQQLHDGAALRLAALSLRLGAFSHRVPKSDQELRQCLDEAQEELHAVLQELRDVASQIYPPVLAAGGLGAALEALAERHGVPVTVRAPEERYGAAVETAAYFAVADGLRPFAGRPGAITVTVRRGEDELLLMITGDGELDGCATTARIPCA
jgi:signal transduction histidine kinase